MTNIRNPVIRYVCKLLANTFFARRDTGAVNIKELSLVYQGLKNMLTDIRGERIEPDFGDNINYGCIFAAELVHYKSWAETTRHPDLYIGSMITPLLQKAGVDFTNRREMGEATLLSRSYLVTTWFLKQSKVWDNFHYKVLLQNRRRRLFNLPNPERTALVNMHNVRFELSDHECIQEDQPPQVQADEEDQQRDPIEELNELELPEIPFTARTNRERLMQSAYKTQRKINTLQKKLITKLFRKVKKFQPPGYVSSAEEEVTEDAERAGAAEEEEEEDSE